MNIFTNMNKCVEHDPSGNTERSHDVAFFWKAHKRDSPREIEVGMRFQF